jgi:hypothetical protein
VTAALTGACGAGDSVFIEAPDVPGARSFLFALEQGSNLDVHAVPAESQSVSVAFAPWFLEDEPLELERVALPASLDELGLSAGIVPSPTENHRTLLQLRPIAVHGATLLPDAVRARFEPTEASLALRSRAFPSGSACPRFADEVLVEAAYPIEAISLGPDTAVALDLEEIFRFRADKSFERWPLPAGESGSAIALSDTGRVWVATKSTIFPFEVEEGRFGPVALQAPGGAIPLGLFVRERGPALVFWLLLDDGQLLRSTPDGTGFELVLQVPPTIVRIDPGTLRTPSARFHALGEEDFLVAAEQMAAVVEFRAGRTRLLQKEATGRGFGLLWPRPDGSVIAPETFSGELLEYRAGAWKPIGVRSVRIWAGAPLDEDRLLYATQQGLVGVLDLLSERCPYQSTSGWGNLRTLARLGDGYLFAGIANSDRPAFGWLTPLD